MSIILVRSRIILIVDVYSSVFCLFCFNEKTVTQYSRKNRRKCQNKVLSGKFLVTIANLVCPGIPKVSNIAPILAILRMKEQYIYGKL